MNNMSERFDDYLEDDEFDYESSNDFETMYVVVDLNKVSYGIKLTYVNKIGLLPKITPVPDSKHYISGVIKERELSLPIIDTRLMLGMPSLYDSDKELINMLKQREEDHISWVNELISSVNEKREFKLTTDPHACAFGVWYDNYKTENIGLADYIRKFDKPHRIIHNIGIEVAEMVKGNQTAAALKLIEEVRNNELAEMIELFGNIESVLRDSHRELSIIINRVDSQFSIKADRVDKIVSIDDSQVQKNTDKSSRFVKEIANLGEQTVLILDLNELEL